MSHGSKHICLTMSKETGTGESSSHAKIHSQSCWLHEAEKDTRGEATCLKPQSHKQGAVMKRTQYQKALKSSINAAVTEENEEGHDGGRSPNSRGVGKNETILYLDADRPSPLSPKNVTQTFRLAVYSDKPMQATPLLPLTGPSYR